MERAPRVTINNRMAKKREGDGGCHSQQFLLVFLGNGKAFIPNKIFSCSLILGTSVHEKLYVMAYVYRNGPKVR